MPPPFAFKMIFDFWVIFKTKLEYRRIRYFPYFTDKSSDSSMVPGQFSDITQVFPLLGVPATVAAPSDPKRSNDWTRPNN